MRISSWDIVLVGRGVTLAIDVEFSVLMLLVAGKVVSTS